VIQFIEWQLRRATARYRRLPDFIIVGAGWRCRIEFVRRYMGIFRHIRSDYLNYSGAALSGRVMLRARRADGGGEQLAGTCRRPST